MDSSPLEAAATSRGRAEHTGATGVSLGHFPSALDAATTEIACIRDAEGDDVGVGSDLNESKNPSKSHLIKRDRRVDLLHSPEVVAARRDYEAREDARVRAECDRIVRICNERDAARPKVELTPAQHERHLEAQAHDRRAYRLRRKGRPEEARRAEEQADLVRQSLPGL